MERSFVSPGGQLLLGLKKVDSGALSVPSQFSEYTVLFIENGEGIYKADFGVFPFKGPVLLFSTPFQTIQVDQCSAESGYLIQFHGDFYCIEFHKAEVACNGLLFNNIYIEPSIALNLKDVEEFRLLINQMCDEIPPDPPNDAVLTSYLQLFLAKASRLKINSLSKTALTGGKDATMEKFKDLVDQNFLTLHKPSDYAKILNITPGTLAKKSKKHFKKSPSELIQERLVLESKKRLHLTRLSIKEIAYSLNFKDEYYFSRFFKKISKVSPQSFRNATGISIVADLSMD